MIVKAPIRILTVDDHPLLLEGLATIIRTQPEMVLVGQASNGRGAIKQVQALQPDVTLIDLRLPDMSGIDAMIAILAQRPQARIIIMTTFEGDGPVQRALEAGASSYILKNMPPKEIVEAIRRVHAGKKRLPTPVAAKIAETLGNEKLTHREVEVFRHTADGERNRDIAYKLFIAEETVKAHMRQIMQKLGASDRTHAVTIGLRRGFLQL